LDSRHLLRKNNYLATYFSWNEPMYEYSRKIRG
jgi:hypothetical protein